MCEFLIYLKMLKEQIFLGLVLFCLVSAEKVIKEVVQEGIFSSHKTVMIAEVYREGAMTPKIGNALNLGYIRKLGSNAVTEIGMRQHYNLGIQVKSDYKELISSISSSSEVKVFSSSNRASILSAISHNLGMFKRKTELEIGNGSKPLWVDFEDDESYSDFETRNINIPLIIAEKGNDKMFLSKFRRICPKAAKKRYQTIKNLNMVYSPLFGDYYKEFNRYGLSPSYFEKNVNARSFFDFMRVGLNADQRQKKILKKKQNLDSEKKILEKWDLKKIYFWYDTVISYIFYFGYNPRKMKNEVVERLKLLQSSFLFGVFNTDDIVKLYTTKISEEIHREFLTRTKKNPEKIEVDKLKYLAFSTNEMSFGAMMIGLGLTDSICNLEKIYQNSTQRKCNKSPDYTSNLLFELSEKQGEYFVRVFYNSERHHFCKGGEEYCPLENFLSVLEERMITERFASICGSKDSIIMPNSHYFVVIFLLLLLLFFFRNQAIEMEGRLKKTNKINSDPFG